MDYAKSKLKHKKEGRMPIFTDLDEVERMKQIYDSFLNSGKFVTVEEAKKNYVSAAMREVHRGDVLTKRDHEIAMRLCKQSAWWFFEQVDRDEDPIVGSAYVERYGSVLGLLLAALLKNRVVRVELMPWTEGEARDEDMKAHLAMIFEHILDVPSNAAQIIAEQDATFGRDYTIEEGDEE